MNYKQIGALFIVLLLCGSSVFFLKTSADNDLPTIDIKNDKPLIACNTKFDDLLSYASASDNNEVKEFFIEEKNLIDVVNNRKLTYVAIDESGNVNKEVIYVDVDRKVSDKKIEVIKDLEVEFKHDFLISDYFRVKNGCGWEFDTNLEVSGMDLENVGEYEITVKALKDSSIPELNTKLIVKDFESPIITLKYDKLILEYEEDYDFTELIDKLEDNKDDYDYLFDNLIIESNVDNQIPGTYEVKFIVTDSDDKTSSITITVIVNDKPEDTQKPESGNNSEGQGNSVSQSNKPSGDNNEETVTPSPEKPIEPPTQEDTPGVTPPPETKPEEETKPEGETTPESNEDPLENPEVSG